MTSPYGDGLTLSRNHHDRPIAETILGLAVIILDARFHVACGHVGQFTIQLLTHMNKHPILRRSRPLDCRQPVWNSPEFLVLPRVEEVRKWNGHRFH